MGEADTTTQSASRSAAAWSAYRRAARDRPTVDTHDDGTADSWSASGLLLDVGDPSTMATSAVDRPVRPRRRCRCVADSAVERRDRSDRSRSRWDHSRTSAGADDIGSPAASQASTPPSRSVARNRPTARSDAAARLEL
jgi:hypothetical protein